MSSAIYLDNSATTRVRDEVVEAMLPYLSERWGNPSSVHKMGRQAQLALAQSRQQVAKLINCQPEEVYFTPCGTYSNNVAVLGRARFAEANGKGRHLITTTFEHSALLGPAKHLESLGWRVTYLPVDREGLISVDALEAAISADTSIISIMAANNEIGTVEPIEDLASLAAERGIYFHTDAIQMTGRLPLDMAKQAVGAMSLSGHKFYAPKGVGVLFVRQGVNLMPLVFGGGQERALFPGTEALAQVVAIGMAAELAARDLEENGSRLRSMQKILMDRLLSIEGVELTGPADPSKRLPGHVSVTVDGAEGETLVLRADLKGVCISSASACHHGIMEPSHVLQAIGVPPERARGSARITAGRFNTEEECRKAADILAEVFASASRESTSACQTRA